MEKSGLIGLAELSAQLTNIGVEIGGKTLRQAVGQATLPAFKAIQMAAPVGSKAHRTYKGNLVAPGFLKRSIKRRTFMKNGVATAVIGAKAEAFYGVNFVEIGTKKMPAHPWLVNTFANSRNEMEARLIAVLRKKIEKIAKKK